MFQAIRIRSLLLAFLLGAAVSVMGCQEDEVYECTNLCSTAFNDLCEDGGHDSVSEICEFGSDCNDCGIRVITQRSN